MEKRIQAIYNDCWKNYKQYLADHDMTAYNERSDELLKKYGKKYDIVNLLFWFAPLINKLHEEYMRGESR